MWKEFFSVCHMMGYDGDVSLEMEDLTMTVDAGVIPPSMRSARRSASKTHTITQAAPHTPRKEEPKKKKG